MIINYGIGENYLKDWGIQEALREIYQNFIDYGSFNQKITKSRNGTFVNITLTNDFKPTSLSFLKIGETEKGENKEAIGQHGEGLKMALLVMLRLDYSIGVFNDNLVIFPIWDKQELIGKTFAILIEEQNIKEEGFKVQFCIPKEDFNIFNNNLIKQKDILYSDSYHGDIVNKEVGNLYVGKLFVANIKNFKKSYNISPSLIKLDRDRKIPGAFETSYHTSKINESQAKINFNDQNYDDFKHIDKIPQEMLKDIKPKIIGNNIKFVAKQNGEEIVITNPSIEAHLKQQSYFEKAINSIKRFLVAKLGVKDLLISFRNKYASYGDARKDFDIILERLGIELDK